MHILRYQKSTSQVQLNKMLPFPFRQAEGPRNNVGRHKRKECCSSSCIYDKPLSQILCKQVALNDFSNTIPFLSRICSSARFPSSS